MNDYFNRMENNLSPRVLQNLTGEGPPVELWLYANRDIYEDEYLGMDYGRNYWRNVTPRLYHHLTDIQYQQILVGRHRFYRDAEATTLLDRYPQYIRSLTDLPRR